MGGPTTILWRHSSAAAGPSTALSYRSARIRDPQVALANHQAALIDITRALIRLQPLQDADPAIRRKCETLKSRLKSEQERIGLLMSCIERLADDGDGGGDNGGDDGGDDGGDEGAAPDGA